MNHDRNLVRLLDKCSDYDLHLSAKKLQFKTTSVTFMGHRLTDKGLEPDSAKISAITEMLRPEGKAGVQRFLGMCQYLSKFCPHLSESVIPLRELTKQDFAFTWSDTHVVHPKFSNNDWSILNSVTMTGWPDERKSVPEEIRGFWSYREEITADNGVLFKLDQVIVPSSLRAEMLRKIHKAHQGYESSIRRARECLFWPGMQLDIRDTCLSCGICSLYTPRGQQSPCSHTRYPHVPGQR